MAERVREQEMRPGTAGAERDEAALDAMLAQRPPWDRAFVPQLHRLRDAELERTLPFLLEAGRDARVLELGGGDGWQAARLAEVFREVTSIDVEAAHNKQFRMHPVIEYDGHRIPLPDDSCDLVFSSNVLEHIPHVVEFQREIQRVLAPGGRAVHVLPSATWRFWVLVAHFPELPRWLAWQITWRLWGRRAATDSSAASAEVGSMPAPSGPRRRGRLATLGAVLLPHRHGERGNVFSELWLFSRAAWHRLFRRTGWKIERSEPLHLFYTGKTLLGTRWSIAGRTHWSRVLGSATHLTVLSPEPRTPPAPSRASE